MLGVPEYVVDESGPDHQKSFHAVVKVGGRVLGSGQGRSKKAAEQEAAKAAWNAITAEAADVPVAAETDAAAGNGDLRPGHGPTAAKADARDDVKDGEGQAPYSAPEPPEPRLPPESPER
jgi:hypothetical protein